MKVARGKRQAIARSRAGITSVCCTSDYLKTIKSPGQHRRMKSHGEWHCLCCHVCMGSVRTSAEMWELPLCERERSKPFTRRTQAYDGHQMDRLHAQMTSSSSSCSSSILAHASRIRDRDQHCTLVAVRGYNHGIPRTSGAQHQGSTSASVLLKCHDSWPLAPSILHPPRDVLPRLHQGWVCVLRYLRFLHIIAPDSVLPLPCPSPLTPGTITSVIPPPSCDESHCMSMETKR